MIARRFNLLPLGKTSCMSPESRISFHAISDVGMKRTHNEDAFHISADRSYGVLADGMGGRHHGEVAAHMTVDMLRERFESYFPASIEALRRVDQHHCADMVVCYLDEWIREVNRAVWNKGQADEKFRDMGTTLVTIYALPSLAVIAHIGDSRVYHLSEDEFVQVTDDHSFVNSQVANGMMTAEEAQTSTQRNIITRAIGTSKAVKPEIKTIHWQPGDRLLLCSDGLTDMVSDDVIREILLSDKPSDDILTTLVGEANANGGRDNITIVLAVY